MYIALLRGVNVGGKNKVSMKELKRMLEDQGYQRVQTYLNSGNVLFDRESGDVTVLKKDLERLLWEHFHLEIPLVLLTSEELLQAVSHAPSWWGEEAESKHNVLFIMPPCTAEEVISDVGAHKPEYESVGSFENVIFWSAPLKTFSRTRWSKIVGRSTYHCVTIRNANTVRNLAKMVE